VGFLVSLTDPQLIVRSQGLKDGVRKYCPQAQLVGEVEAITVDKGADASANMLQAHPNMKVILAFGDDPGIGAYAAAMEAGRTNPDEFLVGSADGTRLGMDKVALGGIYQCCATFFFSFSATQAVRDMAKCLSGQPIPPTRIMGSKLVTKQSVAEYQRIAAHPRAPEYQRFYSDVSVMRYSDVPLKTPKS
jgi:ABC-type sugar transport system substrate-binding protein